MDDILQKLVLKSIW